MNSSPVATLPDVCGNPGHPIGELMETTIETRDANPVAPKAAPVRRRSFVTTANGEKWEAR